MVSGVVMCCEQVVRELGEASPYLQLVDMYMNVCEASAILALPVLLRTQLSPQLCFAAYQMGDNSAKCLADAIITMSEKCGNESAKELTVT